MTKRNRATSASAATKRATPSGPSSRPDPRRQSGGAAHSPKRRGSSDRRIWIAVGLIAALLVGGLAVFLAADDNNQRSDEANALGGTTGPDFHSLVVDPATPARLFVGGHQAVSESNDGGGTWSRIESLDDADAMGWGFSTDAIFVSGHPGLNRSTNGGRTFARMNEGLPGTDVHAFGAGRNALYGAAVDAGVFASTDGGRSWQVRNARAGQSFFGRIVVDPADDNHLLAADARAGVAESTDGGRSWRTLNSGLPFATWLSRSGDGGAVLVASGPAGAVHSTDGGRTWARLSVPDGASLVELDPTDPNVLYAGTHQGTQVTVRASRDGGRTWRPTT